MQQVADGGVGLYALNPANQIHFNEQYLVDVLIYPFRFSSWNELSNHEKVEAVPMLNFASGGCEIEYFLMMSDSLQGFVCVSYYVSTSNLCVKPMYDAEGKPLSFLDWYSWYLSRQLEHMD